MARPAFERQLSEVGGKMSVQLVVWVGVGDHETLELGPRELGGCHGRRPEGLSRDVIHLRELECQCSELGHVAECRGKQLG